MMKQQLAYIMLLVVAMMGCTTEGERAQMRSGLDSINSRNRNDQPFTVQDVAPYVRFFDDHGTPNDRLLAHYLLGRAYYEHGEAPMALECYHDAVECADTTSADCNYAQLARVYGQMSEIFYHQGLYRQQLELGKQSVKYAWLGRDTLAALMSYEQESFAYKSLGMPDSAIFVIEDVASKYKQYGYPSDAAIALGTIIGTLVDREDYQRAKYCIDTYESKSGLFDVRGDIAKGKEYYYRLKGLYYFSINSLDSAEYYFRKELCDGKDFNNQSAAAKGLTNLYQKLHRNDSAAKYAVYAYAMNDSLYAQRNTKDIARIQSMFDYSRHQAAAIREHEKATQASRQLLLSLIVLLTITLTASWLYIARRQVIDNHRRTASELNTVREELAELRLNNSANEQSIKEKELRITQLEQKLGKYARLVYFGAVKAENDLQLSPNYQRIKASVYKGQQLQERDWTLTYQLTEEYLPGYTDFLNSNLKRGSIEYRVCLLLRLHFKAGEIANALSVTPPYISKVSTAVLANLFGKRGSSKELSKELIKIS